MSIEAMVWVFRHSTARLADRLVLLAIADEADDDGTNAWPSQRRIADKARLGQSTVRRAIENLERLGELEVERPERTGRGHYNRYRVLMEKGAQSEHLSGERAPEKRAETRLNAPLSGAYPQTPRPVDQEQTDVELTLDAVPALRKATVEEIFDFWREATNHRRAKLDPKRQRCIEWARRHYDDDDIADAIRGAAASPFHQGQNDRGTRYDDLALILRDAEHLERFAELGRQGPVQQVPKAWGALADMYREEVR